MDAGALFQKMAVDMEGDGVSIGDRDGAPALMLGNRTFAVLAEEWMQILLPEGHPSRASALGLFGARPGEDPRWVQVPVEECNEWERLARAAVRPPD